MTQEIYRVPWDYIIRGGKESKEVCLCVVSVVEKGVSREVILEMKPDIKV